MRQFIQNMTDRAKTRFLLVGNGSYANRGCEAIVRGTMEILRKEFGGIDARAGVYGLSKEANDQISEEIDPDVHNFELHNQVSRWSVDWLQDRLNSKFGTHFVSNNRPLLPHLENALAALEIGGDNFSLDYGLPRHLLNMDQYLLHRRIPVVLWGASVGPFDSEPGFAKVMLDHLRTVNGIFVRESFSRDYLAENGISGNVRLMSDPAFLMNPAPYDPDKFGLEVPEGAIGLNFSPLMAKYLTRDEVQVWNMGEEHLASWRSFCVDAVIQIAALSGRDIILIPHVGSLLAGIDDFRFLEAIAREAKEKAKVNVICVSRKLASAEMKAIISKCHIFAGARTHSTIAALSSQVPTLSLGYSMKARGLNQDIFGSQDYCISIGNLKLEALLEKISLLLDNRDSIAGILEDRIPEVKRNAYAAGPLLREILTA